MPAIGAFTVYTLFLIFFDPEKTGEERKKELYLSISLSIILIIIIILAPLATWLGLLRTYGSKSKRVHYFGVAVGYVASAATIVQWLPQIIKTYLTKKKGSLSIFTFLIQFPGSLIVVFFQAILENTDVSTWLPFLINAIQQAILLVECSWFWWVEYRDAKKKLAESSENNKLVGINTEEEEEESKQPLIKGEESLPPNTV